MSVSTRGIIRKGVSVDEIAKALNKYGVAGIHSYDGTMFSMSIATAFDAKVLFIFYDYESTKRDTGLEGVYLSIGNGDISVDVIKCLCETFGGYIDENDCDDEGFYPVNEELFKKGVDNPIESFKHEVIAKLGYDNLKKAMELFEKYKNLL